MLHVRKIVHIKFRSVCLQLCQQELEEVLWVEHYVTVDDRKQTVLQGCTHHF